mmetsp:Transcript_5525/g.9863  ORF Transcript_5525/g.9863 Transcript_5525/m.9863 type:complete len:148 (+) Transcript_5525:47-490(+)
MAAGAFPVGATVGELGAIKSGSGFGNESLKNARVVAADSGLLKLKMEVSAEHVNPLGTLHGACSMLMLDLFTTFAIMTIAPRVSVSVNMSGQYTGAAKLGDELIIECRVDKTGKSLAYTSMTITSGGKLVFTGQHTKMFLEPPKAKL